jgi:hypothetical protein
MDRERGPQPAEAVAQAVAPPPAPPTALPSCSRLTGIFRSIDDEVPGWFLYDDAAVLDAIDAVQRQDGVRGDLLEVGAFVGKSAILLGHLLRADERLHVCDPFEHVPSDRDNASENARYYTGLQRAQFEANYRRYHEGLPEILQCVSEDLRASDFASPFRLVHIDGSHEYQPVRSDIRLARSLLCDGGLVALDDFVRPHAPGVAAASWEAVLSGGLQPVCLTESKLYGTWSVGADTFSERLVALVSEDPLIESHVHTIDGRQVTRFTSGGRP